MMIYYINVLVYAVMKFMLINGNYIKEVDMTLATGFIEIADVAIVPIADVHRGMLRAVQYAKRIATDVRAVCVVTSEEQRDRIERRWNRFPELTADVKLVLIDYEYRDILEPLIEYINKVSCSELPCQLTTIVIPEFITSSLVGQLLHNQTANILRLRLRAQTDIVVIDVPYHIGKENGNEKSKHAPKPEKTVDSDEPVEMIARVH